MFRNLFRFSSESPAVPLRHRRGLSAEDFAAVQIRRLGWRIIGRRIRTAGRSDIDILAVDGSDLVFVEVRSKQVDAEISALQSIREKKRRQLLSNVRYMLRRRRLAILRPRIDIFLVDLEDDRIVSFAHRRGEIPCAALHPQPPASNS